jgi:ankyrin repeat protein
MCRTGVYASHLLVVLERILLANARKCQTDLMDTRLLFKAAKNGDVAGLRIMLDENPKLVHERDEDQSTPLHWAAWKGHAGVVELLLDHGADIQAHNANFHWGTTPLHAAAHGNQRAAAEALIARGADINAVRSTGSGTPLDETKAHNATAVAKLLKAAGAE